MKAVLNKDKEKRPSIFDVAKIPCIRKKIEQFIMEHNCKDEVMAFFDVEPHIQNKIVNPQPLKPEKEVKPRRPAKKEVKELQSYIIE